MEEDRGCSRQNQVWHLGLGPPSGIKWRGAIFLTNSTGKLEFLNSMVAIFEAEIDSEGNFSEKFGSGNNLLLRIICRVIY